MPRYRRRQPCLRSRQAQGHARPGVPLRLPLRPHWLLAEPLGRNGPSPHLDALMDCARAGDAQAFRKVTEALAPPLTRFITGYLRGDRDTAHDVVQETFLQAWHKLPEIESSEHLRPWLYTVARYKAISFLRRRGPGGTPMESIDVASAHGYDPATAPREGPLQQMLAEEVPDPWIGALRECLDRLPPTYLGVIRLHYLHGRSAAEVAHLLGIGKPAVKMRLLRARRLLKRLVLEEVEARREA